MKKSIVIAGIMVLMMPGMINKTNAQAIVGFNAGLGTYDMSNLRTIMKTSVEDIPVSPVLVADFPPFLYYQPSLSFNGKNWNVGFNFTLFSSGSRWSIRDYSGEYRLDALVRGYAPAFFAERILFQKDKFRFYLHGDAGFVLSTVQFNELFRVWDQSYINSTVNALSLNIFISPQLNVKYPLTDKVTLEGFTGLQLDVVRGPLMSNPTLWEYVSYLFERYPGANWSGFRASVGVTYAL